MEPVTVLKQHLQLCSQVYELLLEENTWLKVEKTVPKQELLEKKQNILPQLELSLLELKIIFTMLMYSV